MLTLKEATRLFNYDPIKGTMTNKVASGSGFNSRVGSEVGCSRRKEWRVRVNYASINVKHIAWLFNTGEWPKKNVLSKDLNVRNIKKENLFMFPSFKSFPLITIKGAEAIIIGVKGKKTIVRSLYRSKLTDFELMGKKVYIDTEHLFKFYKRAGKVQIPV